MNYLAHIYLSGTNPGLQVGNFIGDFVKGNRLNSYPADIRKGVELHRLIDSFTDTHPVVREIVRFIRPVFGRYSGIITDMYFDYFLALHFKRYSDMSLRCFSYRFYISALVNYHYLPSKVKRFIFHFIFTNRLNRYSTPEGLKDSLKIMSVYKLSAIQPDKTIDFLITHHDKLEKLFFDFFDDLLVYVRNISVY